MFGIPTWADFAFALTGEREALDATIFFQPDPCGNQLPKETPWFAGARR